MIRRFGRREGLQSFVAPAILYGLLSYAIAWSMWPYFYLVKNETIIVLGVFALWRYGWQITHYVRALLYGLIHYPMLRRKACSLPGEAAFPQHIYFIIPSYREEPWVSVEAIQSVLSNMVDIPSAATLIIATGSDRDDAVIRAVVEAHPVHDKVSVVLQRQSKGKRIAMGHALRALARRYREEPNSVTVFMDGDSYLQPGTLRATLPFFSAFPDLGALTTNEIAYINSRSRLYKDWFNLKFGQRHVLFQSHSLSHKVLTLTGRFSMLRSAIVVREDFIRQIEFDVLDHWMHGRFRFLMGDDKSSWFYLMKHGWKMLYIPDVTVYSLESRDANFFSVSRSLPYRWYGNTLRNNARALALGPRRTGFFIWLAILDQRLSMWTSLVGIAGSIILTLFKSFIYLPFYLAWVLAVRVIQMGVIALTGHPVSWLTIPLMLYNQWVGALVKIRAFFFLADQKWAKGDAIQTANDGHRPIPHPLARYMPAYTMALSWGVFAFALLVSERALSFPDAGFFRGRNPDAELFIEARAYGVVPNDGMDDALALQTLLDRLPDHGRVTVTLPEGEIDLYHPVSIRRDALALSGQGMADTRIVAHLSLPATAAVSVIGSQGPRLGLLREPLGAKGVSFPLAGVRPGELLLLKQPNDPALFARLGSRVWQREYPVLRQAMVRVARVEKDRVYLEAPTGVDFDAGKTEVWRVRPAVGVSLRDFSLEQRIEGADARSVRSRYENLYPEQAIDLVALNWTERAKIERVCLLNAGRHPLSIENSYAFEVSDFRIDGAWNKGGGGNGYLRIARSYHGWVHGGEVRNIRHIALQWSAAYNRIEDLKSAVDINFHGGMSHHNTVSRIEFSIPATHPWPPVFRTPDDAGWAPPDGPGNEIR